ncbi:cyanophycinase [soil metagenome]
MKPKGKLILIGGSIETNINKIDNGVDEDKYPNRVILPEIINLAGGAENRIELLTCASGIPEKVWEDYRKIFKKLGAENLGNLFIRDHEIENNEKEILRRLEKADLILLTGGDQKQLINNLRGTEFHELMLQRYLHDDFIIAGTSAGAMALSGVSILGEKEGNIYQKDDLIMDTGLGFMNHTIIDTHFTQRSRLERLAQAIVLYPDKLGIGIGEDTALIIKDGNDCEVIGSGKIILIDGTHFEQEKLGGNGRDTDNEAIPLFNLTVHILFPGDEYFIQEKKPVCHYEMRSYQK